MEYPLGNLGKYPGCRCGFRALDENGECWVRCGRRVDNCEECFFGGNKETERKPARPRGRKKQK